MFLGNFYLPYFANKQGWLIRNVTWHEVKSFLCEIIRTSKKKIIKNELSKAFKVSFQQFKNELLKAFRFFSKALNWAFKCFRIEHPQHFTKTKDAFQELHRKVKKLLEQKIWLAFQKSFKTSSKASKKLWKISYKKLFKGFESKLSFDSNNFNLRHYFHVTEPTNHLQTWNIFFLPLNGCRWKQKKKVWLPSLQAASSARKKLPKGKEEAFIVITFYVSSAHTFFVSQTSHSFL